MTAVPAPERTFFQLLGIMEARSGRRLELRINDNRVSYVSFAETAAGGPVRLRLQRSFLTAPEEVLRALADWVRRCRGRCPPPVRRFIESSSRGDSRPPRPVRLCPRGRCHDLDAIMAEVNRDCFRGALSLRITWSRGGGRRRRVRQRQLGAYDRERRLVRVSRVLDRGEVPRFFVAFVVFHEMLHSLQAGGAGRDHDAAFRRAERAHPDFRRAGEWQRRNLDLLMAPGAGTGRRRPRRAARTVRDRRERQGLLF